MKIYLSAYSLLWNNHQLRTGSASPLAKEKTFTLPPYAPLPGYQWEPLLSDCLVENNNCSNSTRPVLTLQIREAALSFPRLKAILTYLEVLSQKLIHAVFWEKWQNEFAAATMRLGQL